MLCLASACVLLTNISWVKFIFISLQFRSIYFVFLEYHVQRYIQHRHVLTSYLRPVHVYTYISVLDLYSDPPFYNPLTASGFDFCHAHPTSVRRVSINATFGSKWISYWPSITHCDTWITRPCLIGVQISEPCMFKVWFYLFINWCESHLGSFEQIKIIGYNVIRCSMCLWDDVYYIFYPENSTSNLMCALFNRFLSCDKAFVDSMKGRQLSELFWFNGEFSSFFPVSTNRYHIKSR